MQKIIKLYTNSHNYSNTEVRRTTNSLNPMMVFDNMHEHSSHLSFYKHDLRCVVRLHGYAKTEYISETWPEYFSNLLYHY